MKKQNTFYKKYEFKNIPKSKKISITHDNQKLYYCNNGLRVYIQDIEDMPLNSNNLIHIDVLTEFSNDTINVSLYVEINDTILCACIHNPQGFIERDKLMLVAKQCYEETCAKYNSNIIIGLLENALDDNEHFFIDTKVMDIVEECNYRYHKKNLEWMIQREKESETEYYLYTKPLLKFSKYFIDISKGEFVTKKLINKEDARFRGGILVNDNDSNWIYDFVNLANISHNIIKKYKEEYFQTTATLVVCSRDLCNQWKIKVNTVNKALKCIVIDNYIDHTNISYNDIMTAHFVIVNYKYLLGSLYKKLWKTYFNGNVDSTLEVMKNEYVLCESNVKKYSSPILSFFYWNRIIIDTDTSYALLNNLNLQETLFRYEGYFRWIQLNKLPSSYTDMMVFIRYLIKNKDVTLPLYNYGDDSIVYLNDVIRLNNCTTFNTDIDNFKITESLIRVNMLDFERQVYNFCVENSHDKNNKQFNKILVDCINQLSINWLLYDDICVDIKKYIKTELKKLKPALNNDQIQDKLKVYMTRLNSFKPTTNIDCGICRESKQSEEIVIPTCGHNFCINCALNIIKYSSACPYCRENINIHTMYHIKHKDDLLGSKLQQLTQYIKYTDKKKTWKCLILCKYANISKHMSSVLKLNKMKHILLFGTYSGKIKKINRFSDQRNSMLIMSFDDIHMMNCIKNLTNIIFHDDPYANDVLDKSKVHNLDIYDKRSSVEFSYLVYNNTKETTLVKI